MNTFTSRLITPGPDRLEEIVAIDQWAFADRDDIPGRVDQAASSVDWDRWVAIELVEPEPGRIVAVSGSWHFDLPVPGGLTLPTSGLTWVGVHPQFRRRGLLRQMLTHHFDDCANRGESLSLLTAAEVPIYTRFGYGQANQVARVTLPRGVDLRPVPGADQVRVRLEKADLAAHLGVVQQVHRAAATGPRARPGWVPSVIEGHWSGRFFDPVERRDGAESLRIAVAESGGQPTGYALFRRREHWTDDDVPEGVVTVIEFVALDPPTTRALWGVLTDFDLQAKTIAPPLALDDPLFALVEDPRQLGTRLGDWLHARIIDLPAALAGRRYSADIDIVLEVTDPILAANAGLWRLRGGRDQAEVARADRAGDVALDIRLLASLYLGGMSAISAADAGLLTASSPGAVEQLATAFASPRLPITSRGF